MERKSNITIWQLNLFEGFDRDIMVMQRDEQEVFDDALHVFFDREYYDAYVSKASKYSSHSYAYHEDKLGEVVNQIFDENINGLVLHMNVDAAQPKNVLCEERYLSAKDLLGLRDAADSYHHMYLAAIERGTKEEAAANLWTKYVYIIGHLPDFRKKPANGEKQIFELMTMKRKKDGSQATAENFDYESLKVFLTPDSAMRFNPDKKPVSKYKLSMLSQLVKGKFHVIVEPHRNYWLEYDPADIDLKGLLDIPQFNEETVRARIKEYFGLDKLYILLMPQNSDYARAIGNPFLMKLDEKNVMMYIFEKYDNAVSYALQNPTLLPALDGIFPIGVLDKNDKLTNLNVFTAIAEKIGVTGITLEADTKSSIVCKMEFFKDASGGQFDLEQLLDSEELAIVVREGEAGKQYRIPAIPFYDKTNEYAVSSERISELASHIDGDKDQGLAYLSGCTLAEHMAYMRETAARFEKARTENDEEKKAFYNRLMNRLTIPLTELLCEKPYIFTLRDEKGGFVLKNELAYLIVTNRYEAGRKGEGRLMPAGVDNEQFTQNLCEACKAAVLTDGPSLVCVLDTKLMSEVAKQWKRSEALREELMIYLMQGCGFSYNDALYYFKRLKTDSSIFVEFTAAVRDGAYPSVGMLNIDGNTAKTLAEQNGLNYAQAYNMLLSVKLGETAASGEADSAAGPAGKKSAGEDASDNNEDSHDKDKKGLFGRLFKK